MIIMQEMICGFRDDNGSLIFFLFFIVTVELICKKKFPW